MEIDQNFLVRASEQDPEHVPHVWMSLGQLGSPLKLLIDTGSTINLIQPNIFPTASRSIIDPIPVTTINSETKLRHKLSLTCDEIDRDTPVEVKINQKCDGLLGIRLLKQFMQRLIWNTMK